MNKDDTTPEMTQGQVLALSIVTAYVIAAMPDARALMANVAEYLEQVIEGAENEPSMHPDMPIGMRDLWRNLSSMVEDELRSRKPCPPATE